MTREQKIKALKLNSFISKQADYTAEVEYDEIVIGKIKYVRPTLMAELVSKHPALFEVAKMQLNSNGKNLKLKDVVKYLKQMNEFKSDLSSIAITEWIFDLEINLKNFNDISTLIQLAFNTAILKHQLYWNAKKHI